MKAVARKLHRLCRGCGVKCVKSASRVLSYKDKGIAFVETEMVGGKIPDLKQASVWGWSASHEGERGAKINITQAEEQSISFWVLSSSVNDCQ